MFDDPKNKNTFLVNNISLPAPNDCTTHEQDGRLAHKFYNFVTVEDFFKNFELSHSYQTIILPNELQNDTFVPSPPSFIPTAPPVTLSDKWQALVENYEKWSKYPAQWGDVAYEHIRYFLADKNYLNISKQTAVPGTCKLGVVQGVACHPYQPLLALALPNCIALYSLPHYATDSLKYLRHELITGINCISFRPNAGNTIAVGYRDGIAIWTIKNTPQRHPHLLEGFHPPTNTWVTFLKDSSLGSVTSIAWDSNGEYIIAGSAQSGKVGVWKITGKEFSLVSHTGPVELVLWSPDDILFSSHAGGLLNFWDGAIKQEFSKMEVQAAAFSPDGKFLALATSHLYIFSLAQGKKEIAKCIFVEPYVNLAKSAEGVLSELHAVESLAWSPDGKRLALSFSALPAIALYAVTQLNQSFSLAPVGYVNPTAYSLDLVPHIQHIAFLPNYDRGSLLSVCYSSGVVTFVPLNYPTSSETTSKSALPTIPTHARPELFAQPSSQTPKPVLPSPQSSPVSGPILSPITSPGYKVLYNRRPDSAIKSPGFTL